MAQFAIDEVLTTGIQISGFIFDYSNRLGTAGQVLTSTASGVMWQADSSIVDLSSLSGQIAATGTLLNNRINSLSGYSDATFATITNLAATGSTLDTKINTLSGYSNANFATILNLATTGSTLDTKINTLSGYSNANFATILNLATTGSTLDTKINTLSGYSNANFATITNLAATGSTLNAKINSLSGYEIQTFLSGSGTQYYVPRWNTSKELVTGSIYDNGNVGIGTTNPSNKTTIEADAVGVSFADNAVAQLVIRGATDTTKRLGLGVDTTSNIGVIQAQKYGTAAYPLALNPVGGNVGIGTTSPATTLDVNGTTFLRGNLNAGKTANLNTTTALNGTGGGNRGFDTSFTGASSTGFTGTDNADQGFGYFAATIVSGRSYEVSATMVVTNGAPLSLRTSTGLNFATQTVEIIIDPPVSNTTYRFVATADATYIGLGFNRTSATMTVVVSNFSIKEVGSVLVASNSNVGIGITNPVYKLQLQADNPNNGVLAQFYNYNAGAAGANGAFSIWTQYGIADWFIGQPSGVNALTFGRDKTSSATGVEYMRIDAGGNLGLGVLAPTTLLSVGGAGSTLPASGITFGGDASANLYRSAAGALTIDGSLGIGTSPSHKLHVYGADIRQTIQSSTDNSYLLIGQWDGSTNRIESSVRKLFLTSYTSGIAFGINGSENMTLDTNGNLGIGSTNPSQKLDVNGSARFANIVYAAKGIFSDSAGVNPVLEVYNTVATNAATAIFRQTTAGGNGNQDIGLLVDIQGASDLDRIANFRYYDGSTYTSRMAIMRGGNVGIGTTNPAYKLDVSGGSVRVFNNPATNNWGLTLENTNVNGWGVSQYFRLYGYNSTPAASFDVLQIVASYPGFGQVDFFVKSQAQSTASTVMSLLGNGNVGIGTVSPTTLLSVGGASSTSAASGITFGGDASANLYRISSSRIKTDGSLEVAIGIISPTITSLSGNIAATGSTLDTKINTLSGYSNANFATILNLAATGSTLDTKINTLSGYSNANFATILNLATTGSTLDTKINTLSGYSNANFATITNLAATGSTLDTKINTLSGYSNANFATITNLAATGSTLNARINSLSGYAGSTFLSGQGVANWTARWNGTKELITGSIYDLGTGVGIGTTSPNSTLDVYKVPATSGTLQPMLTLTSDFATAASINFGSSIVFRGKTAGNVLQNNAQISAYNEDMGDNGYALAFFTRPTVAAGLTQRMTILRGGNVGIGSTSPANKLTVTTSTQYDGYYLRNVNGVVGTMLGTSATNDDGNIGLYSSTVLKTNITANGVSYFNGGNVGIGVASPTTLLSVGGAGSTLPASGITFGADSQANLYRISSARIKTDGNFTIDGQGGGATSLVLNRSSTSSENGMAFNTAGSVDWYFFINDGGTDLQIQRSSEIDSAPRVRFNGSNKDILFNLGGGNIGVGTSIPTGKVHIVSSIVGETVLRADGTNGTLFSVVDDLSDSLMSVNNSAGLPVLEVFADDRVVAGQYGSGDFVLVNNKVGIGTSNPVNKLSVIGAASIGSSTYNTSAPSNGLIVEGSVGIGTTNPSYKLDVIASVVDVGRFYNNQTACQLNIGSTNNTEYTNLALFTSNGNAQFFKNRSSASWGGTDSLNIYTSNGGIAFHPAGETNAVYFANNGRVGIGITSPLQKLQVDGVVGNPASVGVTQSGIFRISNTTDNAVLDFGIRAGGLGAWIQSTDETSLAANYPLLLNPNGGNVGIGTTNPTGKLSVDSVGANAFNVCDSFSSNVRVSVGTINNAGAIYGLIQTYQHNTNTAGVNPLTIQPFGGNVGIGTSVPTGLLNVTRNSNTAQPIAFFKELYGSPAATNILLLERGNNLSAADQTSSNAGLRIRDHSSDYSLSIEDHNSNVNFAISGSKVLVGSRGTNSLLNVGGAGSVAAASGLTFGEDASANLYRSAASTIKTDGNLVVAGTTSLNGHTYGKKTVTLTTASYTTVLTVNLTIHTSCYVKIGAFGDWGAHSAVAFVSELFIQNGDNGGYAEPGTIITAHDNTAGAAGDKIDIQIVDPAAAGTQDFLIQLKLISASSSTYSSIITYHVMGQQASVT